MLLLNQSSLFQKVIAICNEEFNVLKLDFTFTRLRAAPVSLYGLKEAFKEEKDILEGVYTQT